MCESGTVGVALLHISKRVCPVGMDIGSYFAGHFDEDSLELHSIPVIHWESSPKFPDGEIFFYFRDRDPGGRKQRRALRVMFSDVSKSTLLTNNCLNAVLGPLLGGPDRGLSPAAHSAQTHSVATQSHAADHQAMAPVQGPVSALCWHTF